MSRAAILCLCAALALACDKRTPPPTPAPQPSPGTEQITGSERLGWDQAAATATELATFRYLIYVDDGAGTELEGVSCAGAASSSGFACAARLPTLSAGPHSLALSSFIESGTRLESARSAPLSVIVTAPLQGSSRSGQTRITTVDGVRLRADVVASGLDRPTDLAMLPDGGILIAERGGRVRIFRGGRLLVASPLLLEDTIASDGGGLLAIAVDPQFDRTQFLYAIYTTESRFRLARFRAADGRLGERAILVDTLAPASPAPAATLRFGPDGKLYVGLDDGGDQDAAGDLGSFNGKVLRLNAEGTTPADQPGGTPILAINVNRPRGVDWDSSGALWIVETNKLQAVEAGIPRYPRGSTISRYSLPDGTGASALGFYRDERIPAFRGNLFIAASDGRAILRLMFDPASPAKVTSVERLFQDLFEAPGAVAMAPDGAVYVCSGDALIRIAADTPIDR